MAKKQTETEAPVEQTETEAPVNDYDAAMKALEAGTLKAKVLTSQGWVLPNE